MIPEVFFGYVRKLFPEACLSVEELADLMASVRFKFLKRGEKLFFEGSDCCLYVVFSGRLKLVDFESGEQDYFKELLHEAEFFGDITLLNRKMPGEYAQALSNNTTVCFASVITVKKLIARHPSLALHLAIINALKAKKMEQRYLQLAGMDARTRLILFLKSMAHANPMQIGEEIIFEKYLSLNDMAAYLSVSRQRVYTLLKDLSGSGYLRIGKRTIAVKPELWMIDWSKNVFTPSPQ
jgi:CRP-like cAMP-binding protein